MAEERIDKLTIEIDTKISGQQNLEKYKNEMKKVVKFTKEQRDLMEEMELLGRHGNPNSSHAKQFKKDLDKDIAKARKEYEKYNEALNKSDKATKKAAKSTSKLADAFVRIVRFKIVAAILQKAINAAKEGVEALAEYDDQFKDTLNSYQASFKQIGGGAALALSPVLSGLDGMVGLLSDGVGALTNTISALVAGLSGKTSYTAVKTFKEIKEEIAAADKKAKDLRHTISGFDELNIFSNKNKSDTVDIFKTNEIGGMDYAMDVAGMTALAATAGVVGKAIKGLTEKFAKKNKTLQEQTQDTKEDAKETSKLGDVLNALVPGASRAAAALGALGALILTPLLDVTGITKPAAEAKVALDKLGETNPAPAVDTSALGSSIESSKNLVSNGMSSIVTTLDAKFSEIGTKFKTMVDGMSSAWSAFLSGLSGDAVTIPQVGQTGAVGAVPQVELTGGRFRDTIPNLGFDLSGYTSTTVPKGSTASSSVKSNTEVISDLFGEEAMDGAKILFGAKTDEQAAEAIMNTIAIGQLTVGGLGLGKAIGTALGTKASSFLSRGIFAGGRASGGIVSSGEFFMARENGIPEFVGSFGSRTGVANNEQIVSGIAGGVESALSAYVPQIIRAIENNAAVVNIGDDQIARSAQRGAARYQRITGQPMFS